MTEDLEGFVWTGRRDEDGNLWIGWKMPIAEARDRARKERRRHERRFRDAPFPLYGLPPQWPGDRLLGGGEWGGVGGRERTKALSLVHGSIVHGEGPMLTVETATERVTGGDILETIAGMLRSGHASDVRAALSYLEGSGWDDEIDVSRVRMGKRTFLVDKQRVTFELLEYEEEWVAWAEVPPFFLTVRGKPFEPHDVELVRVIDLKPYIDGTHLFYERGE